MKIGCVIQARLGSSRLPNKVMMDICGKPMLQRVIERVQQIPGLDEIVVAFPHADQPIGTLASQLGAKIFGQVGNTNDVLSRYYWAAKTYNLDVIVRITADCPAIDPEVAHECINLYNSKRGDFASNVRPFSTYPDGTDVEVFSFWALKLAQRSAQSAYDREHVTAYLYNDPKPVLCHTLVSPTDYSHIKWSVDTQAELDHIRRAYTDLGESFHMKELLEWEYNLDK